MRPVRIAILAALMIVLCVSAFFMANVEMPPWSHAVSAVSVVLFSLPAIWALTMWLGRSDALIVFAVLALFAILVEIMAISTGIPYGHFGYSDHLGYRLFGTVPWTVSFAWPPLILAAYAIAANLFVSRTPRVLATTILLVIFDMVLDPGAVRLGFWKYTDAGNFYDVPISNFAGWMISGFAGSILLELLVSRFKPLLPVPIQLASSGFLIVFFWSSFAAFAGMAGPALIGTGVLAALIMVWRRRRYSFDDMIVFVDEQNNAVGTAPKLDAHNSETQLHRAFSVFIFNRHGELLLQQRSFSKKTWPGVWSNSCCGHVMLHESTQKAAARRLRFELGISGVDLTYALPNYRYRAEKDGVVENEICPVLIGMYDGNVNPNPNEVASTKWLGWSEFLASLDKPETEISPWAVEEARLLATSEIFKAWFAQQVPLSAAEHVSV